MTANTNQGGRPPKYKDANTLDAKMVEYFDDCIDKGNAPTWASMLLYLGLCDETLRLYRTEQKYIEGGYLAAIKNAERRHCDFWQQYALSHPNLQTFCIFELKQPHNGGFIDRQQVEQSGRVTLDVAINGSNKAFD